MEDHLVSILKNIFKNKKPCWVKISEPTVSGLMGSTFYKKPPSPGFSQFWLIFGDGFKVYF